MTREEAKYIETIDEALITLTRIEKKLEKCDGLFKHSKERDDIKIILDCILEYREMKKRII